MGRDWLYKASGGRGDGSGRGGGNSVKDRNTSSSSGCMSAIYNQFRFHHPSFISESAVTDDEHSNSCLQGIEAPRNSLECPESAMNVASSTSEVKEEITYLNIPLPRVQIKTKLSRITDELSTECCSSPGTKTPNLVARLMGLDILPEFSSPRPSSSSTTANTYHRSRSLPSTPRLSTASRHSTENDYHHRLSLQIDKENSNRHDKHITHQARERSSRRLGTDITNTMSPARSYKYQRRDSNLDLLTKPKRGESNVTQLSNSPKLRLLDIKSNLNKPVLNSHSSSLKEVKSKCLTPKPRQTPVMKPENVVKDEKIKRIASERYDLRLKKMHQQQKVNKKKSTALTNDVLNVKNKKKFHSFKKDMASCSSTTTRLSQKEVSLPSNLNSSYNSNHTHNITTTAAANRFSFSDLSDGEVLVRDMGRRMRRLLSTAFETEAEGIVVEIEREIFENLVHEIAGGSGMV